MIMVFFDFLSASGDTEPYPSNSNWAPNHFALVKISSLSENALFVHLSFHIFHHERLQVLDKLQQYPQKIHLPILIVYCITSFLEFSSILVSILIQFAIQIFSQVHNQYIFHLTLKVLKFMYSSISWAYW